MTSFLRGTLACLFEKRRLCVVWQMDASLLLLLRPLPFLKAPGDKGVKCTECRQERVGLYREGLDRTSPSETSKQSWPSVSGICGIVDSSSRRNKNKCLPTTGMSAKSKGETWSAVAAAGPGVLGNGTLAHRWAHTHPQEVLLNPSALSASFQINSSSCPSASR